MGKVHTHTKPCIMRRTQWPLFIVALAFSIRSSTADLCYEYTKFTCAYTSQCKYDYDKKKCLSQTHCSQRQAGQIACERNSPKNSLAPDKPCVWDGSDCKDPDGAPSATSTSSTSAPAASCTCSNGTPASGSACTTSGEKCVTCNAGFELTAANKCNACAAGYMKSGTNTDACVVWTPCTSTQLQTAEGSTTAHPQCTNSCSDIKNYYESTLECGTGSTCSEQAATRAVNYNECRRVKKLYKANSCTCT